MSPSRISSGAIVGEPYWRASKRAKKMTRRDLSV
jgi:hypothetical protein